MNFSIFNDKGRIDKYKYYNKILATAYSLVAQWKRIPIRIHGASPASPPLSDYKKSPKHTPKKKVKNLLKKWLPKPAYPGAK
jgi:hypothetical protein